MERDVFIPPDWQRTESHQNPDTGVESERGWITDKNGIKHDPLGLLDIGAPKDEYISEAASILGRMKDDQNLEQIESIVVEEFERWFSKDLIIGRKDRLKDIAKNISKIV